MFPQSSWALGIPCGCSAPAASDLLLSAGTQWLSSRHKHCSTDGGVLKHSSQQGSEQCLCLRKWIRGNEKIHPKCLEIKKKNPATNTRPHITTIAHWSAYWDVCVCVCLSFSLSLSSNLLHCYLVCLISERLGLFFIKKLTKALCQLVNCCGSRLLILVYCRSKICS